MGKFVAIRWGLWCLICDICERQKKLSKVFDYGPKFLHCLRVKMSHKSKFLSKGFFSRDRLVFFPMSIRDEIKGKLALFMLWIAWNCVEMIPTDSHCSFAFAIDIRDPKLLNSTKLYTQKLNFKAIIGNCTYFMRVMQKII